MAEPGWEFGFCTAHLDGEGRPVAVVTTQVGDSKGRPDLTAGTFMDVTGRRRRALTDVTGRH